MRPNGGAVEESHAQLNPIAILRPLQQTLPYAAVAPAIERLCGHPPRPQMGRNTAPFRTVRMPPDDRLDGASQINALGLVVGTTGLVVGTTRFNQRRQLLPLC